MSWRRGERSSGHGDPKCRVTGRSCGFTGSSEGKGRGQDTTQAYRLPQGPLSLKSQVGEVARWPACVHGGPGSFKQAGACV